MQTIFNAPMASDQLEKALGWSLPHRETAQTVNDFVTDPSRFEDLDSAFESKDLLDALPILAKPVVEIRTRGDLTMFESSMTAGSMSRPVASVADQE